jgi:hypothetical protein
MKKAGIILSLIFGVLIATSVWAYSSNFVSDVLTLIDTPEKQQVFFGELSGQEHFFVIDSAEDFNLYINILIPDLPGVNKDFSLTLSKEEELLFLDGKSYTWAPYVDTFSNDHYYQGPSADLNLEAGNYVIEVFSADNNGKYALIVGNDNNTNFKEFFKQLWKMPRIKHFFETSPIFAYLNRAGLFTFSIIIFAIAVISQFTGFKRQK